MYNDYLGKYKEYLFQRQSILRANKSTTLNHFNETIDKYELKNRRIEMSFYRPEYVNFDIFAKKLANEYRDVSSRYLDEDVHTELKAIRQNAIDMYEGVLTSNTDSKYILVKEPSKMTDKKEKVTPVDVPNETTYGGSSWKPTHRKPKDNTKRSDVKVLSSIDSMEKEIKTTILKNMRTHRRNGTNSSLSMNRDDMVNLLMRDPILSKKMPSNIRDLTTPELID
jgi:hypothetical protein